MNNTKKDRIGERYINNQGSWCTIVNYKNNADLTVKFDSGYVVKTRMADVKKGGVKDLLFPTVLGHGYVGIGEYKVSENGKATEAYAVWHSMLNRCYNPKSKQSCPTYEECYVCDEWLNFQMFAEWHYEQNKPEGWQIDKDLTQIGNRVYSPQFCTFVPREINSLLCDHRNARGNHKQGVCFSLSKNKYSATISIDGKIKFLGYFLSENEAYNVYKKAKEETVKMVANRYKNEISEEVYNSLIKWTLQ